MTRERIEALSGRELDEAVAELMGECIHDYATNKVYDTCTKCGFNYDVFRPTELRPRVGEGKAYSEDIAAVWPLAEKFHLTVTPTYDGWEAAWCNAGGSGETSWVGVTNYGPWMKGKTAPEAISRAVLWKNRHRAALLARMGEEKA